MPRRVVVSKPLETPAQSVFGEFRRRVRDPGGLDHDGLRASCCANLLRDPVIGKRIVPIIPDEARTFGLDPLFKEVGIYTALGQRYDPVDSNLMLSYREATDGQVLEEGITEAGSVASLQAAATSYGTHGEPMIPFYIFYSMFGFQRTGDQFWQLADARGRGFVLGGTAGRTTLNGEGLQHEDGHSLVLASTIPSAQVYDPAFAYETAAIVRDGIRRMYGPDAGGPLLLPRAVQREPRDAGAGRTGSTDAHIVRGPVPVPGGAGRAARGRAPDDAPGRRLDHAAGAAGPGDPGRALRRRRGRVERHVVPAAAQRGARGRPLEPAPSRGGAAHAAGHASCSAEAAAAGPDRGGQRLDPRLAGHDRPLGAGHVPDAGHGRLRAQRHARGAAPLLRGGRGAHRGRRAVRAGALPARSRPSRPPTASRTLGIDPEAPFSLTH